MIQVALHLLPWTVEGDAHVERTQAIERLAFGGLLVAACFVIYYGLRTVVALGSRRAWLWVSAMLLSGCGLPVVLALTVAVHRACRAHGIPTGLLGPRA